MGQAPFAPTLLYIGIIEFNLVRHNNQFWYLYGPSRSRKRSAYTRVGRHTPKALFRQFDFGEIFNELKDITIFFNQYLGEGMLAPQWFQQSGSSNRTLEDIFQPKDDLCFLVGAGISVDKPCSLPTGYEFIRSSLRRLIPEEEQDNIIALMDPNREGSRGPSDFLRFEQLMQYIQGWFDPDLHILDCFAALNTPNLNQLFLAYMIKSRHLVFTTNFDSMIEHALLETQTPKHQIFPIIYRKDWENPPKKNDCCIYKLHGSLIDYRTGDDCRETMQATLEQIARMKEGNVFTLEAWKRNVLQKSTKTHNLVVLGYSGLDDFDILPTLWSIQSPMKLIWISHAPSLDVRDAMVNVVRTASSDISTGCDELPDRTGGNLLSFVEKGARRPDNVVWIKVNTSKLVEWLWGRYIPLRLPLNISSISPSVSKPLMSDGIISEFGKWVLTGMILHDRQMYSQSLNAFQTALSYSHGQWKQEWTRRDALNQYIVETDELKLQSACINNIGVLLLKENRLNEAAALFRRSLNLVERMDDIQGRYTYLCNLGIIYEEQNKLQEALEHFHKALTLAESIGDLQAKSTNLSHIAFIRQKQQEPDALQYYLEALKIDEQLGDLAGKATRLTLIGVLHQNNSRYDKASDLYHQALEINDSLGNLSGTASCLFNIASVAEVQGQRDKALEYYQRAADIYTVLEDLDGKTDSMEAIADLLNKQERNDELPKVP